MHSCAMGTRFNSFYREELHPFVQKFGEVFEELQRRSNRPQWYTSMMWETNRLHDENVHFIRTFCSDLVNQRRANPTDKKDIFNALLNRRDPVTGKELSHGVITDNMITFLFAGKDAVRNYGSIYQRLTYHRSRHNLRFIILCLGPPDLEPRGVC